MMKLAYITHSMQYTTEGLWCNMWKCTLLFLWRDYYWLYSQCYLNNVWLSCQNSLIQLLSMTNLKGRLSIYLILLCVYIYIYKQIFSHSKGNGQFMWSVYVVSLFNGFMLEWSEGILCDISRGFLLSFLWGKIHDYVWSWNFFYVIIKLIDLE